VGHDDGDYSLGEDCPKRLAAAAATLSESDLVQEFFVAASSRHGSASRWSVAWPTPRANLKGHAASSVQNRLKALLGADHPHQRQPLPHAYRGWSRMPRRARFSITRWWTTSSTSGEASDDSDALGVTHEVAQGRDEPNRRPARRIPRGDEAARSEWTYSTPSSTRWKSAHSCSAVETTEADRIPARVMLLARPARNCHPHALCPWFSSACWRWVGARPAASHSCRHVLGRLLESHHGCAQCTPNVSTSR